MPLRKVIAGILVVGCVAACSSLKSSDDATVAQGPCSTGTPYDATTVFPEHDPNAASFPMLACVKRCGDTSVATWGAGGPMAPAISAVPTGTCSEGEPACSIVAVRVTCADTFEHADGGVISSTPSGEALQFECSCAGGHWACSNRFFGADACGTGIIGDGVSADGG